MTTFETEHATLHRVREYVWEIPQTDGMGVPARVLASEALLEEIQADKTLQQIQNVAHLPGVVEHAICMPDGHQGYGFPVGGVAAIDAEDGCISPGGVGFDINCGVRMVKTGLTYSDVRGREEELVNELFASVPSGLGGGGVVEGSKRTVEDILARGMDWALEHGYAVEDDLAHCEDEGVRPDADPDAVSQKAKDRGRNQIGSLGSGNHFLEVQRVTDIYLDDVADAYGLAEDQIVVLIHCGSRGLGHQVCSDYVRDIEQEHGDLLSRLPDKELAAAPAGSRLAEEYYGAMCAAINFAWVNRQLVTHQTRRVFERVFDADWQDLGIDLLYDVAHNIAKREVHEVGVGPEGRPVGGGEAADREDREVFVHRKGATRAFPAGHPEVPAAYRDVGQPVIIPGSMGAGSYVLRGGRESMTTTFGSTAHGAGRLMSRTQAKQEYWGGDIQDQLRDQQHVYVKAQSGATIAEEAPGVYKDVDEVVRVSDALGIGDRVARTFPVVNIKG
jgi:tRNA-splicing ligase RtcB